MMTRKKITVNKDVFSSRYSYNLVTFLANFVINVVSEIKNLEKNTNNQ